jgi:hypothetical protein
MLATDRHISLLALLVLVLVLVLFSFLPGVS